MLQVWGAEKPQRDVRMSAALDTKRGWTKQANCCLQWPLVAGPSLAYAPRGAKICPAPPNLV